MFTRELFAQLKMDTFQMVVMIKKKNARNHTCFLGSACHSTNSAVDFIAWIILLIGKMQKCILLPQLLTYYLNGHTLIFTNVKTALFMVTYLLLT